METVRNLLKTGLKNLDLNLVKTAYGIFRTKFFTIPPRGPVQYVEIESIDRLERTLGELGWNRDKELSYNYEGEMLNMAKYHYSADAEYPWRQYHVRAFKTSEDGIFALRVHDEPTPTDHPEAHYNGEDQSFKPAMYQLKEDLESRNLTVYGENTRQIA